MEEAEAKRLAEEAEAKRIVEEDEAMRIAEEEYDEMMRAEDVFEKKFLERINRPGPISFTAILANDSYKGLD